MQLRKTFPAIRISENTWLEIEQAIKKYNEKVMTKMTLQDFRRLAYETLSKILLKGQITQS